MRQNPLLGQVYWDLDLANHIDNLPELVQKHPEILTAPIVSDTVTHKAAEKDHLQALELLLEAGVPADVPDKYGKTSPLMSAARAGALAAVQWLLDHGARVDGIGEGKCATPLCSAAMNGHLEVVRLLIERGADVNASYTLGSGTSAKPCNALAWAVANRHEEVAALLRTHGAVMPGEAPGEAAVSPQNASDEIIAYVEKHLGPVQPLALMEIVPGEVPIAVHVVPPSPGREEMTLFTTGMSDLPMNVPAGAEAFRYAEVMLDLPADWPLTEDALRDPANAWPVRWLRKLGKYPHENGVFYGRYMIVSNDEPPQPLDAGTEMCAWLVAYAPLAEEPLIASDGRPIGFYQAGPIYREERDLCIEKGLDALAELFTQHNIDTAIDPQRVNAAG